MTGSEAYDKLEVGNVIYVKNLSNNQWFIGECLDTDFVRECKTIEYFIFSTLTKEYLKPSISTLTLNKWYILFTEYKTYLIATNLKERTVIETLYNIKF